MARYVVGEQMALCALTVLIGGASGDVDVGRATARWHFPDAPTIRSGDLVFRIGVGWRADAVRALSGYALSHVGIAVLERDGVHVVHAEPPGESGQAGVVDQPLSVYSAPDGARGLVIYRRTGIGAAARRRIAIRALAYAAAHVPFDERFDLADPSAFYCTKLVLRSSQAAGVPMAVRRTTLSGILPSTYVMPRDLLRSGDLRLVFKKDVL